MARHAADARRRRGRLVPCSHRRPLAEWDGAGAVLRIGALGVLAGLALKASAAVDPTYLADRVTWHVVAPPNKQCFFPVPMRDRAPHMSSCRRTTPTTGRERRAQRAPETSPAARRVRHRPQPKEGLHRESRVTVLPRSSIYRGRARSRRSSPAGTSRADRGRHRRGSPARSASPRTRRRARVMARRARDGGAA
jgi:hypothetical protein